MGDNDENNVKHNVNHRDGSHPGKTRRQGMLLAKEIYTAFEQFSAQ